MKKKIVAHVKHVAKAHTKVRDGLAAAGAFMLLMGSFLAVSGDLNIDMPSALAAAVASLTNSPTVVITKNVNSPSGTIASGRSQALAVYDVKVNNFTQVGTIQRIVFNAALSGDATPTELDNFVLDYRYCVPTGNIYAYGYRYGYAGTYCRSAVAWPVSAVRIGNVYTVTFAPTFMVIPGQTIADMVLSSTPYYFGSASKSGVKVRVSMVKNNTAVQSMTCTTYRYGYAYRYSYQTCRMFGLNASVSGAVGNWLSLMRWYGYGYTPVAPVTTSEVATSSDAATIQPAPADTAVSADVSSTTVVTPSIIVPNMQPVQSPKTTSKTTTKPTPLRKTQK